MSNRQIPWRRIAERFGGEFRLKTGATRSTFSLNAEIYGTLVEVRGTSVPYSATGGKTSIRAVAEQTLGVALRIRKHGSFRNFFRRDVVVGDECFDRDWVIHAKRESHAQAFLGKRQRELIDSVPEAIRWSAPDSGLHRRDSLPRHYDFETHGRAARASWTGFETNEVRLLAAIEATIALAQRPMSLQEQWKRLAKRLEGRLEMNGRWRDDGSTRIILALRGSRITVSPIVDRLGWRRLRLRTRISCEVSQAVRPIHYVIGDDDSGVEPNVVKAIHGSGALVLRSNGQRIWADLDGNVTDETKIRSAALAVALLAPGKSVGPYR